MLAHTGLIAVSLHRLFLVGLPPSGVAKDSTEAA